PGKRIFVSEGKPLRLNAGAAGRSGRRKLAIVDWDGDGLRDILMNSVNADWLRGIGKTPSGDFAFAPQGPLSDRAISSHTTSPAVVDFNRDGVPDVLIGAEDGRLYYGVQRRSP
ncbi:MAG: VCBS repeat-containing protein, partial [Planctomycetales bacterium]|nr:VCBS repeat-containing protein [Planctomycetales bacterium]